jgi:hypothetical protein
MILRLLKGGGMVSELFEKKRDAIPPHPATLQAMCIDKPLFGHLKMGWVVAKGVGKF